MIIASTRFPEDDKNYHLQGWDLETGKDVVRCVGHTGAVQSVALSPDEKYAASASHDRTVRLWDLRTGDRLRSLAGNMYQVFGLAFSPDGKWLAASSCGDSSFAPPKSSRPEIVRLWEVATGQLHELDGHAGGATSLAFSPDGKVLATAAHDGTVILWDSTTRKQLRKIEVAEEAYFHRKSNGFDSGGVLALAYAPDGKTIASANYDGTVRLFEAATGKPVQKDLSEDDGADGLQMFDPDDVAVMPDLDDQES